MSSQLQILIPVILSIAEVSCMAKPPVKEGPHRGWSETLTIEEASRREAEEREYQNALQRFD